MYVEQKGETKEDSNLLVLEFVNGNHDFTKTTQQDLEAAFDLLGKRRPTTWNSKLEARAREFNKKIMIVKQFHSEIMLLKKESNENDIHLDYWGKVDYPFDIDEKENTAITLMMDPETWSMCTFKDSRELGEVLRHLITYVPNEGRPFVRGWINGLLPCFLRWVSLSNTNDVKLLKTLKHFFAAFGQPGVVSSLPDKGASVLESMQNAARSVEARGRGEVEDYYWQQNFLSVVTKETYWPDLANLEDSPLQISQLDHLPKNWLVDSNDWVRVFSHVVSPEISIVFKKMIVETITRPDYQIKDGPPKTLARCFAKSREYMSSLSKENPARFKNFAAKFNEAFLRIPSRPEDYVWNIIDFARCSINVPSAKDVLNVKRIIEQDKKFTIVSVKNGYSKNFQVKGSGYRDLKLLVKVEFDNLVLRGIPNVEPKTVLICELQILCEKWLDNKRTTSLSYRILRAKVLNSLFKDFSKYRTRELTNDLLAYATAEQTIKHGWCNLAKVADFSSDDPAKLLCTASIEGWNTEGVTYLIEKLGANIEVRFDDFSAAGCTPLILAAKHGNHEILEHLLKYGSNINATNTQFNSTALHWAVQLGRVKIVRTLLKARCDLHVHEMNGDTAKDIALNINSPSSNLILKMFDAKDFDDIPPEKVEPDHIQVMELCKAASEGKLLEYLDMNNVKVSSLSDVFLCKTVVKSLETLLLLFWSGGQVQKADNEGCTALIWAAMYANVENIQLIIDGKAEVDALDNRGFNSLYHSTLNSVEAFFTLLRAGSDVDIIYQNHRCRRNLRYKIERWVTRYQEKQQSESGFHVLQKKTV